MKTGSGQEINTSAHIILYSITPIKVKQKTYHSVKIYTWSTFLPPYPYSGCTVSRNVSSMPSQKKMFLMQFLLHPIQEHFCPYVRHCTTPDRRRGHAWSGSPEKEKRKWIPWSLQNNGGQAAGEWLFFTPGALGTGFLTPPVFIRYISGMIFDRRRGSAIKQWNRSVFLIVW